MFKQYIAQVLLNTKTMANALLKKGYTLVSGAEGADECFFTIEIFTTKNIHI